MRLEGLHCQWAAVPLGMVVSLCELIEPLRVVAGQLPEYCRRACGSALTDEQLQSQSGFLLVPYRPLATRLQWLVLNPLEELGVRQRARLVLHKRHRREREAERARSQGLVERVARV